LVETISKPPYKLLESRNLKLKTLTELRRQSPAEMELLRRAYVKMMEG
jgi:ABC-type transporter lipoprotein component MlaA